MNKWISLLGGLLLAQLVLALGLNLSGDDYGAFEPQEKLLVFDPAKVDRLLLSDGENKVTLAKTNGEWQLPDQGGFPADSASAGRLVERLAKLEKGWPMATSSGALDRFKVAGDRFERKIALYAGTELQGELYVGSSPGFRKVHVRPANEDRVFAANFSTWEASSKADDWIDKDLLELDSAELTGVRMADINLTRNGDQWNLEGLTEDETLDRKAVTALLQKISGLRIQSLAEADASPETPVLELRVERKDGQSLDYRFFKGEGEDDYQLRRSDLSQRLTLAAYAVKPLLETKRSSLIAATPD